MTLKERIARRLKERLEFADIIIQDDIIAEASAAVVKEVQAFLREADV